MSVSLHNIAAATGVSEATVSNALNNRGRMSESTKNRILKAAEKMGYTPNIHAQNLAVNRSKRIGIIVPDIENPFYGRLIKQVSLICRESGYSVLISDSLNKNDLEKHAILQMISERIEGLLIVPVNNDSPNSDYISILELNNIKYCFLSNLVCEKNYPVVMTDLSQGTFSLVNHLIDIGRNKIYFLVGKDHNATSTNRIDGYRRAFESRGLRYDSSRLVYCDNYNFTEGFNKTTELINSALQIDAIIAINDFMAVGALSALSKANISVPGQIAVAGYDDMFFAQIALVPLTTVKQNIDEMSRISVEMIINMIDKNQQLRTQIYLQPELVIRDSTN